MRRGKEDIEKCGRRSRREEGGSRIEGREILFNFFPFTHCKFSFGQGYKIMKTSKAYFISLVVFTL